MRVCVCVTSSVRQIKLLRECVDPESALRFQIQSSSRSSPSLANSSSVFCDRPPSVRDPLRGFLPATSPSSSCCREERAGCSRAVHSISLHSRKQANTALLSPLQTSHHALARRTAEELNGSTQMNPMWTLVGAACL